MIPLLKLSFIHAVRSRLLLLTVVFALAVQYLGVKLVKTLTVYFTYSFQGMTYGVKESETFVVALVIAYGSSLFLAAVYGAWHLPFSHKGPRAGLTYVLPVSRWLYPLVYSLTFLGMYLIQAAALLLALYTQFGFGELKPLSVIAAFGAGFLPALTLVFAMGAGALTFGAITSFLVGSLALFLLSVNRAILYLDNQTPPWWWTKLPPVGEVLFDMGLAFEGKPLPASHMALWAFWLVLFMIWFRWRLSRPSGWRSSE